jgi:hypothetical protein
VCPCPDIIDVVAVGMLHGPDLAAFVHVILCSYLWP